MLIYQQNTPEGRLSELKKHGSIEISHNQFIFHKIWLQISPSRICFFFELKLNKVIQYEDGEAL